MSKPLSVVGSISNSPRTTSGLITTVSKIPKFHIDQITNKSELLKSKNSIKELLSTKKELRSQATNKLIGTYLLGNKFFHKECNGCSQLDLYRIASECYYEEYENTSKILSYKNDPIYVCYIIIHGFLINEDETIYYIENDILGIDILSYQSVWNDNIIITNSSNVALCCIPSQFLLKYIGKGGEIASYHMRYLWKYLRLSSEANCSSYLDNIDINVLPKRYKELMKSNNIIDSTMDVTNIARIRSYQPGTNIFTQNDERTHFYLFILGESKLLRKVKDTVNNSIDIHKFKKSKFKCFDVINNVIDSIINKIEATYNISTSKKVDESIVDTNQIYLSNDFILFDSEKLSNVTEIIQNYMNNKAILLPFKKHLNTLIAVTYVEAVVIPIYELIKNPKLIESLTLLSESKYPKQYSTDEDLLEYYRYQKNWVAIRHELLKSIYLSKLSHELNERYYININNNLSKDFYDSKTPSHIKSYHRYYQRLTLSFPEKSMKNRNIDKPIDNLNKEVEKGLNSKIDKGKYQCVSIASTVAKDTIQSESSKSMKFSLGISTISNKLINELEKDPLLDINKYCEKNKTIHKPNNMKPSKENVLFHRKYRIVTLSNI